MYTGYFGLSEPPFSLTPDPRYLFMSERHREGLAHLLYGVQQPGGFVQLTGEVGSGKTTLSRCLVRQLPPETDVALILNPRLTALELLASVCDELGIQYPAGTASIKVLIDALNRHLLEAHARKRKTVLIIDEAQNLDIDVLEQIRLLTNLETSQQKLLQIILIGQPELLALLKRKGLRQLAQRITARYHLLPLSRPETASYIRHRLFIAGRREAIFTPGAMRCVYRLSGGVPRLINAICDRALLGAYALDKRRVTVAMVRHAGREALGLIPWTRRFRASWIAGMVVMLALALGGAVLLTRDSTSARRDPQPAIAAHENQAAPEPSPALAKKSETAESSLPAPTAQRLVPLLAEPSHGLLSASFSDLFARWGVEASLRPGELGCKAAERKGFQCLFLSGGWPALRRYAVPAILQLNLPGGVPKRATLVALSDETATLAIGGREYGFPLQEIEQIWDGSFIALWRPPFPVRNLAPGTRGAEVAWVRRALDTIEKKAPEGMVSDLYDDDLQRRVLAFQREHSLTVDGLAGRETLVRLTLALDRQKAPALVRDAR